MADRRLILGALGAAGGLAFWALTEPLLDMLGPTRAYMTLAALTGGLFLGAAVLTEALRPARALVAAAAIAAPAALMLLAGSSRFLTVPGYLGTAYPLLAWLALVLVPAPYAAAHLTGRGWRDPEAIFELTWAMALRLLAALAFTAVAFAVLGLSSVLLDLVGVTVLDRIMRLEVEGWIVAGAVVGLSLGVIDEFGADRGANVVPRLLRLLAPLAAAVLALFLVMLPVRGLSDLFGDLSPAATMLCMAALCAVLATAAADGGPERAATGVISASARLLAGLLVAPAALAAAALWLRVSQHGWTVDRVAGAAFILLMLLYGAAYLWAALTRWPGGVRAANPLLGLAAAGIAAIWLLPGPGPEGLAARSIERSALEARADARDLWMLGRELGRPGRAAIARIREGAEAERLAVLDELERAETFYEFSEAAGPAIEAPRVGRLAELMEGVPREVLASLSDWELARFETACERIGPDGLRDCAGHQMELDARLEGAEYVLVLWEEGMGMTHLARGMREGRWAQVWLAGPAEGRDDSRAEFAAFHAAPPPTRPAGLRAFELGGRTLIPSP